MTLSSFTPTITLETPSLNNSTALTPSFEAKTRSKQLGLRAVELLREGVSNVMVGVKDDKVITTDLQKAIKGHNEINKELLRVAKIMTT
jgi:6-phosphofructokinase 1